MEPSKCCGFLPILPEVVISRSNPFSEVQQVQLRAQIIVYGSIIRDRVPEETLMSLCFADISKGDSVDEFHDENLKRKVWEKIWQTASTGRTKRLAKVKAVASQTKTKAKPGLKRKACKPSVKKRSVKQKNISDLDSDVVVVQQVITDAAEAQSNSEDEEEEENAQEEDTELEQLAASAIKAMSDLPVFDGTKNGREVDEEDEEAHCKVSEDNTSRGPGDLTDEKVESVEYGDAETSNSPKLEEKLKQYWKDFVQGAVVEVISDEDGLHGVWFSGKVKTVRKDKVQVVYDDLLRDDGQTMLQEWVSFDDSMNGAPKIRLAHPVTSADVPLKKNNFSVGDHVDAWMNDGWWEGIVEGINSENQKQVTLFFPGEGDIGVAKVSHLRPSLVWKHGEWILCSPNETENAKQVTKKPVSKPCQLKKCEALASVVLNGKRKRERPKRLADGLDDDEGPRKSSARKTSSRVAIQSTRRTLPPRTKASSYKVKRK